MTNTWLVQTITAVRLFISRVMCLINGQETTANWLDVSIRWLNNDVTYKSKKFLDLVWTITAVMDDWPLVIDRPFLVSGYYEQTRLFIGQWIDRAKRQDPNDWAKVTTKRRSEGIVSLVCLWSNIPFSLSTKRTTHRSLDRCWERFGKGKWKDTTKGRVLLDHRLQILGRSSLNC